MNGIHLWTVTLIFVTTSFGHFPVNPLYGSYIVLSSTRSEFEYRGGQQNLSQAECLIL